MTNPQPTECHNCGDDLLGVARTRGRDGELACVECIGQERAIHSAELDRDGFGHLGLESGHRIDFLWSVVVTYEGPGDFPVPEFTLTAKDGEPLELGDIDEEELEILLAEKWFAHRRVTL